MQQVIQERLIFPLKETKVTTYIELQLLSFVQFCLKGIDNGALCVTRLNI
jgi:hypothetical protein